MTATHRTCWFPDNTVLCNFAAVDRLDLLGKLLDGRGRWTEAVAHEASCSARYLPPLGNIPREGWLGEPIAIDDPAEAALVDRLRRQVFGGDPRLPLQHLGEAETLTLIRHRVEYVDSVWITDDGEAGRYARRQGIAVRDTVGLMGEAAVCGMVTAPEGHGLLTRMVEAGRRLREVPGRPDDLLR